MPALVACIHFRSGQRRGMPAGSSQSKSKKTSARATVSSQRESCSGPRFPGRTTVVTGVPRHRQQLGAVENPQLGAGRGDALDKLGLEE